MKTRIKEKKEAQAAIDKKYELESDGEDEMPEAVSNSVMKSNYDQQIKEMENAKQNVRQAEKAKRRQKQEKFIAQKKSKLSTAPPTSSAELPSEEITEEEEQESADVNKKDESVEGVTKLQAKPKPTRKVYPSLNITVEPLTKIHDSRASSAISFKDRRLAKVPRESVKSSVISYQKKLQVRK